MLRVMLDSNIFDEIIKTRGLAGQLRSLTASGRLDIVVTHVQEDELAGIQAAERRRAIQQVPRRSIPTAVFFSMFHDLDRRARQRRSVNAPDGDGPGARRTIRRALRGAQT
jgi:hypothetical protein